MGERIGGITVTFFQPTYLYPPNSLLPEPGIQMSSSPAFASRSLQITATRTNIPSGSRPLSKCEFSLEEKQAESRPQGMSARLGCALLIPSSASASGADLAGEEREW